MAITLLVWKLVAKKVNPTWIIIGIFILGIIFSYLNILGVVTS
nr:PTS system mannose/fructose/sorbose family transporter subunit IID [Oenococcus oeni]